MNELNLQNPAFLKYVENAHVNSALMCVRIKSLLVKNPKFDIFTHNGPLDSIQHWIFLGNNDITTFEQLNNIMGTKIFYNE
jgi:hypothetical protein